MELELLAAQIAPDFPLGTAAAAILTIIAAAIEAYIVIVLIPRLAECVNTNGESEERRQQAIDAQSASP